MNGSAVFLIAFFTSAATSVGTVYLVERLNVFDTQHSAEDPKETVLVPKLEGLPQNDAVANLSNIGLVMMIGGREASPTAADDTVLRQSVPAGQRVTKGQVIGVTLATAMQKVPFLIGKPLAEAKSALEKAGYKVEEGDPVHHDVIAEGKVVTQTPEAGMALNKEKAVTLQISKGKGLVEVPKVIGYRYSTAKATLQKQGLKAKIRWVDLAETSSNIVLSQKPKPGKKVTGETEVTIVINRE